MATIDRRTLLQLVAAAPLAAAFTWTGEEAVHASVQARAATAPFTPVFFTAHEYETVKILVDLIIPKDGRSGSATDAGVPEFMDFIVADQVSRQTAMRGGLAWLDTECRERFGRNFVDCDDRQRRAVLDDIAWPARARPDLSHGVAFFNSFRDLTATGFWSSKMGVDELGYMGNTVVPEWKGCPEEQLRNLGVGYGD